MFIWQKRNSKRCRATCKQGHYYASHIAIVKFSQNKVVDVFTGWTCNSIYDMANWLLHVSQIFVLDSNWLSSKIHTEFLIFNYINDMHYILEVTYELIVRRKSFICIVSTVLKIINQNIIFVNSSVL